MSGRPKLSIATQAFKRVYDDIGKDVPSVGTLIGGKVDYNINTLTPAQGRFENACAIRMSYVLNESGFKISYQRGKTVSGKNGNWYLYKVEDMKKHLRDTLGKPDMDISNPKETDFNKKKGILVFDVSWSDATGHATIWNGTSCSDKCYFPKASRAYLWVLKN